MVVACRDPGPRWWALTWQEMAQAAWACSAVLASDSCAWAFLYSSEPLTVSSEARASCKA